MLSRLVVLISGIFLFFSVT